MLKTLISSFLLSVIVLFSGCGKTTPSVTKLSTHTTQKESQNKQIINRSIQTGEPLALTLPDASQYNSIEWRDETGKLLSTDPDINRLFTKAGEYKLYVSVTDKQNHVKTNTIAVKVTRAPEPQIPNQEPIAKAKAQAVDIMDEEYIHLSDDGSYDPDGDIVKYEWRDMDGILLSDTKQLDRMLHYYPQYDSNHDGTTRYVKTLYVTDDKGATSSKSFEIIVHKRPDPNKPPTVKAGADKSITEGQSVTLTATASDPDGTIQSYAWKEGSVIKGNSASLTLNNLSKGVHIFTMTVTDDKGETATDTVKVEVKAKEVVNHTPTATAQSVTLDEDTTKTITLAGTDPDGDTLTYTVVTAPTHGTFAGGVYTPNANYNGSDSFTFKANDGTVDSAPATVNITVNSINDAPTVDAGADATIVHSDSYTPSPTSSDIDGTIASTVWKEGATTLTFPKTDFTVGSHTLTVTVTDNEGATATDTLTLTVTANCKPLPKTGQTTTYHNNDDGDYQKGATRSYTRDDVNEIVTDNVTNLMWQDNESVQKKWVTQVNYDAGNYSDTSGDTATTYCTNLALGGHNDWRLPTIEELVYITDKGRVNPAIDPEFENVSSSVYWSSTTNVDYTGAAWDVYFNYGGDNHDYKHNAAYVRCVRDGQ